MAASRFPDKPLAVLHGIPMVMHCYFRTLLAQQVDHVVIATCDEAIARVAQEYGAPIAWTSDAHTNAVDRTAEAASALLQGGQSDIEVVLLVQGDEPLVQPSTLDLMVSTITADTDVHTLNAMVPFATEADFLDRNNAKVVTSATGDALYMSREAIPSPWRGWPSGGAYMQTGLFAFRPESLEWFAATPRTELESTESIDMLRLLYHGRPLRMLAISEQTIGVDTPDDLVRAASMLEADPVLPLYRSHGREPSGR
jgi:3-deoxy-manno-octulosonate cytidylyltransferase (CMP-KDO synthetase)